MIKIIIILLLTTLSIIGAQIPIQNIIILGLSKILNNKIKDISENDVKFYLYNQENNNIPIIISKDINDLNINVNDEFKFLIHGYTDTINNTWISNMKNEYLKKGNYNIIAVDWREPALNFYPTSVYFTKPVGRYITEFIIYLYNSFNVRYENVHLIGHSLGAHVAGFAGKHLLEKEGKKYGRITGMDPAGPLFLNNIKSQRLSNEDADFVDIIHTDGLKNGYFDSLGHADFYVNEGIAIQPGCLKDDTDDIVKLVSCSHIRSYVYFTESINSSEFIAKKCKNYSDYLNGFCDNNLEAVMGENVDHSVRGIFFLNTKEESPFAINKRIK